MGKLVTELREGAEKLAEKMVERIGSDIEKAKDATRNLRTRFAWTILNKVDSPKMENIMREKLKIRGIEPIGSIHYYPEISNSILEGIPLKGSKAKEDVEEIVNRLEDLVAKNLKCQAK